MLTYIRTPKGVTLVLDSKIRTISAEEPHYEAVLAAIKRDASSEEILDILETELRRVQAAVAALSTREITDDVKISGGQVLFRGEAIHNSLTERMLKMLDEGFDLAPMAAFLANLVQNPDARTVNDLYSFLEFGSMPITPDGHFLAYKAVRKDFMDIHSGTFNNAVGQHPKMLRFKVDPNPEQTCSSGLHVCSFGYLPSFSHADGHVMVCKVNPKDVVAIPADYHNTKMRVEQYEVVGEYEGYYTEHPECLLSKVSVATDESPFKVTVYSTHDGDIAYEVAFARLSDASLAAEKELDKSDVASVTIINVLTDTVVFEKSNDNFDDESDFDDEDENDDDDRILYAVRAFDRMSDEGGDLVEEDIESVTQAKRVACEYFANNTPMSVEVRDNDGGLIFKI
jgi:hypothetical protein